MIYGEYAATTMRIDSTSYTDEYQGSTMSKKSDFNYKDYWEANIEAFGGFYGFNPNESVDAPPIIKYLYKTFVFPLEKKHILKRYKIVCSLLSEEVLRGKTVADIGCGTGVFTKHSLSKGAKVAAIDFTEKALQLTKDALQGHDEGVEYHLLDVEQQPIPKADVVIVIGVISYVNDVESFYANSAPNAEMIIINFLDPFHFLNRLRRMVSILDVRNYFYHSKDEIRDSLSKHGYKDFNFIKLNSGYILQARK